MRRPRVTLVGVVGTVAAILAAIALVLLAAEARADDRPTGDRGVVLPADCPRLNCDPVPCEWYPGGWPDETPETIADATTWWQFDPGGRCAREPVGDPVPRLTLPPTDTAP